MLKARSDLSWFSYSGETDSAFTESDGVKQGSKITVNCEQCLGVMMTIEAMEHTFFHKSELWNVSVHAYEDLVDNASEEFSKMCKYLWVNNEPIRPRTKKTGSSLSESVVNYDEFTEFFIEHGYGKMLDE